MRLSRVFVLMMILLSGLRVRAGGTSEENAISIVLEKQVADWNRGDLVQFVSGYAEHCTLVGSTISETTRAQVLKHYQEKYPTAEARGRLAFSDLNVHRVDDRVAMVTGRWHLERERAAGGPVGGVFSLVFELVGGRWVIVLDHTS